MKLRSRVTRTGLRYRRARVRHSHYPHRLHIGVAATAWHLAYGFWLFAADWGIIIGEKAQKYALYACIGLSVMLFAVGTNAAIAFVRPCGLLPSAF